MQAADFDRLVAAACERIPARFRKRLKNVAMIVEAEPHAVARQEALRVPQAEPRFRYPACCHRSVLRRLLKERGAKLG